MADFVLDGSLALAWCFDDETTLFTQFVKNLFVQGQSCIVPPIWPSEVANGVLTAERRGRISTATGDSFLSELLRLPIQVVPMEPRAIFQPVMQLARDQRLTVYDATYLGLAVSRKLPLATLDVALQQAASRVGVLLLHEK
jgi:predicted nucleic acid-binding protein